MAFSQLLASLRAIVASGLVYIVHMYEYGQSINFGWLNRPEIKNFVLPLWAVILTVFVHWRNSARRDNIMQQAWERHNREQRERRERRLERQEQ